MTKTATTPKYMTCGFNGDTYTYEVIEKVGTNSYKIRLMDCKYDENGLGYDFTQGTRILVVKKRRKTNRFYDVQNSRCKAWDFSIADKPYASYNKSF